jgi:hypothetical protein
MLAMLVMGVGGGTGLGRLWAKHAAASVGPWRRAGTAENASTAARASRDAGERGKWLEAIKQSQDAQFWAGRAEEAAFAAQDKALMAQATAASEEANAAATELHLRLRALKLPGW